MRPIIADLERLQRVAQDAARAPDERDEAARHIRAYWAAHQQASAERTSRPVLKLSAAGWVRVSEAAKLSGLPSRTIRRWCEDGRLPAKKRGAYWYVSLKDLSQRFAGWSDDTPISEQHF